MFRDPIFEGGRCIRCRNPSKTFGTYGNSAVPQRSAYEWIEKLKSDCTNVTHDKGAGHLSTAIIEDNIERARDTVLLDSE